MMTGGADTSRMIGGVHQTEIGALEDPRKEQGILRDLGTTMTETAGDMSAVETIARLWREGTCF